MPNFSSPARNLSKLKRPCIVQSIIDLSSQGQFKKAIDSLDIIARKGTRLDSKTLAFLLRECADTKSLKEGKWVHLHLKLAGLKHPNTFLMNHLINMYCKCGEHEVAYKLFDRMPNRNLYSWNNMLSGYVNLGMMKPARKLFDKIPVKDVVSWNIMVIGYAKNGCYSESLRFYKELKRSSVGFNEFSFSGVLTVCVRCKNFVVTKQIHCQLLVVGFLLNVVISSSLVDAYAKCGKLGDARRLFDEMKVRDILAWTTLVSGYAKCGEMRIARESFDAMPEKNSVSWTALVSGYARNSMGHEALELFATMIKSRVNPDQFTFSSCLCACASMRSLKHGKETHAFLIRSNFRPNTIVVSSLIDMYSKCGKLRIGQRVFDVMGDKKNIILWNTYISALAQHGYGEEAVQMFRNMVSTGLHPDRITFTVILNACSHSGLVKEGLCIYESITIDHGILPDQQHYACLIDLLGRAGHFDEVLKQLKKMTCEPDSCIWAALLGVSRIHGNINMGRMAAEHLIKLEPHSYVGYVALSSIYAALGKWELAENTRQLMNDRI